MVLVGHSYAGMVVTGVAEKVEKSIASIVMLDAFFPETGEALVDLQPPAGPGQLSGCGAQRRHNDRPPTHTPDPPRDFVRKLPQVRLLVERLIWERELAPRRLLRPQIALPSRQPAQ